MFYVYILFSKNDGKLYIGYTDNLKRRVDLKIQLAETFKKIDYKYR